MVENSRPSLQIDLNEFKLHLHLKGRPQLTLHFNSPSRSFYLSVIALVVNEMKKVGKIKSIPLQEHLDLLALLNETIGGAAGSSEKENLLYRIYRKWKDALPNLEEAPLFKVHGKKKKEEGDGAIGKVYSFTDVEKDGWANLFDYMGSEENVRLKFAIDRIGIGLNETSIIFGEFQNGEAWTQFIASLKKEEREKKESGPVEEITVPETPAVPFSVPQKPRVSWLTHYRWVLLVVVIGVVAGATWKIFWSAAPIEVAPKEKVAFSLPDKPSIAVLPFNNLSGDSGQESFTDAITENITTMLSKIPELFVIARNSAFEYKGKEIDVKRVAEKLGVRHILEGSVHKSGERIRITAQLIDAASGHHIWSEKYDRNLKDVFALIDDVTRHIAVALQVKLTEGEQARVFYRDTENLEAWSLATQSWNVISRLTREDNARARELAEQAVKLDAQYGFAWSLLAYSYYNAARMGWGESPKEHFQKAIELNQKALTLNKDLFCATGMLAQILWAQGQYEKAIEMGRRSIELGPNQSLNYVILSEILCYAGNFDEAITLGEKAIRLHPFCRYPYLTILARSYRMAGCYQEALVLYRNVLTRAQKESFRPMPAYIGLADVYSEMGQAEEARAKALEILQINPNFSLENWGKTEPFRDPAHLEKRLTALRKAGLK